MYGSVRENESDIEVCVEHKSLLNDCPVAFPFALILRMINNTASELHLSVSLVYAVPVTVSPDDYSGNSTDLMFGLCSQKQCVNISISDDGILEEPEVFTVSLERPPGLTDYIELVDKKKKVTIIDDDGKYLALQCLQIIYSEP